MSAKFAQTLTPTPNSFSVSPTGRRRSLRLVQKRIRREWRRLSPKSIPSILLEPTSPPPKSQTISKPAAPHKLPPIKHCQNLTPPSKQCTNTSLNPLNSPFLRCQGAALLASSLKITTRKCSRLVCHPCNTRNEADFLLAGEALHLARVWPTCVFHEDHGQIQEWQRRSSGKSWPSESYFPPYPDSGALCSECVTMLAKEAARQELTEYEERLGGRNTRRV